MLPARCLTSVLAITAVVVGTPIQFRKSSENLRDTDVPGKVNINGDLTTSGRISTGEYIEIRGAAIEGDECFKNGLLAQDGEGHILSCEKKVWRNPRATTTIREASNQGFRWPTASVSCADNERVVGGGGDCHQPSGVIWISSTRPFGNGWFIACDGGFAHSEWGTVTAWAICAS